MSKRLENATLTLRTLSGPHATVFTLRSGKPAVIGRAFGSDVCLLHETVSRRHALLMQRAGDSGDDWFVMDQGSTLGTFVNGSRAAAGTPLPLATGDVLRVGAWVFRVVIGREEESGPRTVDEPTDGHERVVADSIHSGPSNSLAERRLALLTECIEHLNSAVHEQELARLAVSYAMRGGGFSRGAAFKSLDGANSLAIEAAASAGADGTIVENPTEFGVSRGLIRAASAGTTAARFDGRSEVSSGSIAELGIHSALCSPVKIGGTVVGFLYLDARGNEAAVRAHAGGFCSAVATAYGLALANIKRAQLERRQMLLAAELAAAREVQQLILPTEKGDLGIVRYAMKSMPGVFVAGDLFDVVPLSNGCVAVLIGDVAGHGAGSAMLMATVQSHLVALVRSGKDPAAAMGDLNNYVCDRVSGGRFVSLWLGLVSPDGELWYVDAGHGHWMLDQHGLLRTIPNAEGGIPIGIEKERTFTSARGRLRVGDRLIGFTDGLIEQRDADGVEFGIDRVAAVLASRSMDAEALFAALTEFAGTSSLQDDATVAIVEFVGTQTRSEPSDMRG